MTQFPMSLLISARDEELTPVIMNGIHKFINELAIQNYPQASVAQVEAHYRKQHNPLYEALALLITKELQEYAKTTTTNPSGRIAPSGEDVVHEPNPVTD